MQTGSSRRRAQLGLPLGQAYDYAAGVMAENMLAEAELRILAGAWKIDRIHVEGDYVVFTYRDARRIATLARRNKGKVRVVDAKKAYIPLGEDPVTTPEIVAVVKSLLSTKA